MKKLHYAYTSSFSFNDKVENGFLKLRSFIVIVLLLLTSQIGFSQSRKDLQTRVDGLTFENLRLKQEIRQLRKDLSMLQRQTEGSGDQYAPVSHLTIGAAGTLKCIQCTRNAETGSKYCLQHKKIYEPEGPVVQRNGDQPYTGVHGPGVPPSARAVYKNPNAGKYFYNGMGIQTFFRK